MPSLNTFFKAVDRDNEVGGIYSFGPGTLKHPSIDPGGLLVIYTASSWKGLNQVILGANAEGRFEVIEIDCEGVVSVKDTDGTLTDAARVFIDNTHFVPAAYSPIPC